MPVGMSRIVVEEHDAKRQGLDIQKVNVLKTLVSLHKGGTQKVWFGHPELIDSPFQFMTIPSLKL